MRAQGASGTRWRSSNALVSGTGSCERSLHNSNSPTVSPRAAAHTPPAFPSPPTARKIFASALAVAAPYDVRSPSCSAQRGRRERQAHGEHLRQTFARSVGNRPRRPPRRARHPVRARTRSHDPTSPDLLRRAPDRSATADTCRRSAHRSRDSTARRAEHERRDARRVGRWHPPSPLCHAESRKLGGGEGQSSKAPRRGGAGGAAPAAAICVRERRAGGASAAVLSHRRRARPESSPQRGEPDGAAPTCAAADEFRRREHLKEGRSPMNNPALLSEPKMEPRFAPRDRVASVPQAAAHCR